MTTEELPQRDSPNLHLVVGNPEEILAQQHANSEEWRGALSLEAYLRREEHLVRQELTKEGGLTAWMLVYEPPDGSKRQVLCGCESIKKKAMLAKEGKVEDAVAHGVASVFCPPRYRGRGYAGRMMSELGKRLERWQAEKEGASAFSVLYSDIGKDFYAARGWQPFPSTHIALPASKAQQAGLPHAQTLQSEDLQALCVADEQLLRQKLSKRGDSSLAAALVPDLETMQWHHAREDFVSTELHGGRPGFMNGGRGALVGIRPDAKAWCYWARVWTNPQEESPNTLHILRLAIEDEAYSDFSPASDSGAGQLADSDVAKAIAALLAEAQVQAHASGMHEIQIWNPTSATLAAARLIDADAAVVQRETESIASLQWYGEGSWKDVEWVCNEKYGWC